MHSLYLATTFAAAIACLLTSLLIFARRKSGERSRVILACIVLFSVSNYITRFTALCHGQEPKLVISVSMLLLAFFMVISYAMYPIEVISPGYLNFRRILKLYSPIPLLFCIYKISCWLGVTFVQYHSLLDMLPQLTQFQVWFRIILALLIFTPVMSIFIVPYTRPYNNADRVWMLKYTICFTVNTMAYMVVLTFNALPVKILYYYISAGCSIYIAYMELFERLIDQRTAVDQLCTVGINTSNFEETLPVRENVLCNKIILHMQETNDYQNPDISLNTLAQSLCTNRTTLSTALRELGYSSFNSYINTLRIQEFIRRIRHDNLVNYQDAFYDVGFRSRTTALRNFKLYTGKTPSEFFEG